MSDGGGFASPSSLQVTDAQEVFGNLHGVEGGSLLDLVAHEPESEAVGIGQIFADATHEDLVLTGEEERHGIFLGCRVVHQNEPLAAGDGLTRLFDADGRLGLYPHAL